MHTEEAAGNGESSVVEDARDRSHQETSSGERAEQDGQQKEAEMLSGETPPPLPSWERADRYEAVLAATAAAAAAQPTDATASRALVEAQRNLRDYYQAAFECLTAMAHTATGDAQTRFRMALQDLALRRHRYQFKRAPVVIKVKTLDFQPGEQAAAEEPLCLGYEDVIGRRIDDLLSGYSEPERQVMVSGLRRILRAHDAALRAIWQYYTQLDLQQLLLDNSALTRRDGETPSPSPSPTPLADERELVALVTASALEGGRLHTRQWVQLVYDTRLADHQLSVVELNRLSLQCMSHPDTRLTVFHDPHGPFRDRVGYYEWIEVLIRAAQVQHARLRGVSRRLEALLTERVVPLGACGRYPRPAQPWREGVDCDGGRRRRWGLAGGVDRNDELRKEMWSGTSKMFKQYSRFRSTALR
jgi:hypothetical protein